MPAALLRKLLRWAGLAALAISIAIIAFLIAAWIGSSIPRNSDWTEPDTGVEIMVETNGVHTGIVMPIVTPQKDWRETFPFLGQPNRFGEVPTHVAFGWGEKHVFLNVPTWSDLEAATALRIAAQGGDGLLRVMPYVRPAPSIDHRPVNLRAEEYARLVAKVEATLPAIPAGERRKDHPSFEPNARNYDAVGRYTLGNTCNQWVGDTLAHAGMKVGRWTIFAGGVMKWVDEPQ
ncbi:hypothetical protein A6F65_01504 [Paraurantiacibacter namhicola]|uniref:DUF2459 domain-containing protein n=1 Tax=Paraurantiacibacter namhicola TaxID=645517 RepID=A0A1C7D8N8_9SPHN|nr:hypothetical protein A6F65_01504 [Paraurantiacibacter namhicola]